MEEVFVTMNCATPPRQLPSLAPVTSLLCSIAQDVKVALIGQGPDELFGGYKRHLGIRYGSWWRGLPPGLRSMLGFAVNRLPRNETLKRGIRSLASEDRLERYLDVFSLAPSDVIDGLFHDGLLPQGNGRDTLDSW